MESNWFTDIPADPNYEPTDFETEAREVQAASARDSASPTEALRRLRVGETVHLPRYQRTPQVGGVIARLRDTDGMTFTSWRDAALDCVAVKRLT